MSYTALQDRIVLYALDAAPHDGWSIDSLYAAAHECGRSGHLVGEMFPNGLKDATAHIAALFDRQTRESLQKTKPDTMRVRDRVATAVRTRLELMAPYRDGLRVALAYQARPLHMPQAARTLWASADTIWVWAGDTATDYNRYTKRALLAGVMAATTLFWLQDTSPKFSKTHAFLERRINQVLKLGRTIGSIIPKKHEAV